MKKKQITESEAQTLRHQQLKKEALNIENRTNISGIIKLRYLKEIML